MRERAVGCAECGHTQVGGRFCGRCGALLEPPTDGPDERRLDEERSAEGASPRQRRRGAAPRWLSVVAVAAVIAGAAALASGATRDAALDDGAGQGTFAAGSRRTENRHVHVGGRRAPFETATGAVALVAGGGTGVTVVELDTGRRHTRPIEEQRPGDQPYPLWALGRRLVVGWGEIWAVAPDDPSASRLLGEASYFVPGSEPDELWLIDRPDWRGDDGPATWTLIDHAGTVLHRGEAHAGYVVERGVPGGLAVRGEDAVLRRYEPSTGRITDLVGGPDARLLDVGRDQVLWCESDCTALQLTSGAPTLELTADDVRTFLDAWLSPDGSTVAAHVAVDMSGGSRYFELHLYDVTSVTEVARVFVRLGDAQVAWTPDGAQLLYRVAVEAGRSTFGRHTSAGFEVADRDPLEGLRPGPFLVGHASWYPSLLGEAGEPPD